jgi:hypothetical protein
MVYVLKKAEVKEWYMKQEGSFDFDLWDKYAFKSVSSIRIGITKNDLQLALIVMALSTKKFFFLQSD